MKNHEAAYTLKDLLLEKIAKNCFAASKMDFAILGH
jgi:hypothetical protein